MSLSAFDTLFAAEAVADLLDQFGERVTYLPRDGAPREITAIVLREPLQALEPIAEGVAPVLVAKALTDPAAATYGGIDPGDDFAGGTAIRVAWRKGEPAENHPVHRLVGVKGGMTWLELR